MTDKVTKQFGTIDFDEITETYAEGMYDGRKFLFFNEKDSEAIVEGNFTDEERLFIFTQWQIVGENEHDWNKEE